MFKEDTANVYLVVTNGRNYQAKVHSVEERLGVVQNSVYELHFDGEQEQQMEIGT